MHRILTLKGPWAWKLVARKKKFFENFYTTRIVLLKWLCYPQNSYGVRANIPPLHVLLVVSIKKNAQLNQTLMI